MNDDGTVTLKAALGKNLKLVDAMSKAVLWEKDDLRGLKTLSHLKSGETIALTGATSDMMFSMGPL